MRKRFTPAEAILWSVIKSKNLKYKFRRQYSIGRYVVDFYSPELKLVVEVDGGYHKSQDMKEYDPIRQEFIESLGLKVLRFSDEEVAKSLTKVLNKIEQKILAT